MPDRPWRVQPTPNPATPNGVLAADSCASSTACLAVGDYENVFGAQVTLAERWNGVSWRVQATPSPPGAIWSILSGVSCTSPDACTAVGYYVNGADRILALAERWNGTRWRVQVTPGPSAAEGSALFAISCASARACTAVGAYTNSAGAQVTLAERWDGTHWAIQATPNPAGSRGSQLAAVSCASPSACTAAGAFAASGGVEVTLAERWDGTRWLIQATPSPAGAIGAGLFAVSCPSPGTCTAAGSYHRASLPLVAVVLVEAWNGTSWRIQPAPSPAPPPGVSTGGSGLLAVWCASPRACAAVGYAAGGLTLAEGWDGTRWRVQATPSPARTLGSALPAISCVSLRACVAAGSYDVVMPPATFGLPTPAQTLAEAWNGKSWHLQAAIDRSGAAVSNGFSAVSCSPPRACAAVGAYQNSVGQYVPLAEVRNGTRWAVQSTAGLSDARFSTLNGVSCTSVRACTAVGWYVNRAFTAVALAERWNGTRWVVQPTPSLANAALFALSCTSARACTAVGSVGKRQTLAEAWNGTRWAIQPTPNPKGGLPAQLDGVSCASVRACTAVGSYETRAFQTRTMAEIWNGTRWLIQATPNPDRAASAQFSGVSCASARTCTAVGSRWITITVGKVPVNKYATLAEAWNGSRWRIQPTPGQPGAFSTSLSAVSCAAARACTAVGSWTNNIGGVLAVAEAWNGASWILQTAPSPPGTLSSSMSGVSCTSASACAAVGSYAGLSGIELTLAIATHDRDSPVTGKHARS